MLASRAYCVVIDKIKALEVRSEMSLVALTEEIPKYHVSATGTWIIQLRLHVLVCYVHCSLGHFEAPHLVAMACQKCHVVTFTTPLKGNQLFPNCG